MTALDVARYILWYCTYKGTPISNCKLQKILYFCWKACKEKTGKPLFVEPFSEWQIGHVVEKVYDAYYYYGVLPIRESDLPASGIDYSFLNETIDRYRETPISRLAQMDKANII